MKIFFSTFFLSVTMLSSWANAVEVGDIYYTDKTFSSTVQSGKKAAGMVYWVSANKDYGYIMSLEEPATTLNPYNANVYCQEYQIDGKTLGEWRLPYFVELVRMGNETINGQNNNKFTTLNNKLKTLTKPSGGAATALSSANYVTKSYNPQVFNPSTGVPSTGGGGWKAGSGTKYKVRCITGF